MSDATERLLVHRVAELVKICEEQAALIVALKRQGAPYSTAGNSQNAAICQMIVEDVMNYLASVDLLVRSGDTFRTSIRDNLFRIISGKLTHV